MNCIIVSVSTERGRGEREQEREREDPEISSSSVGYTDTSGLGTERMNSTKVQNPRREMQVALLAEPKTPPGVEHVYIIL